MLAESALIKSFECADFEVHVITDPTPDNALAYAAIGITGVESFCRYMPFPERREAASIVDGLKSFEDLIEFHYEGVAVGKGQFVRRNRVADGVQRGLHVRQHRSICRVGGRL